MSVTVNVEPAVETPTVEETPTPASEVADANAVLLAMVHELKELCQSQSNQIQSLLRERELVASEPTPAEEVKEAVAEALAEASEAAEAQAPELAVVEPEEGTAPDAQQVTVVEMAAPDQAAPTQGKPGMLRRFLLGAPRKE